MTRRRKVLLSVGTTLVVGAALFVLVPGSPGRAIAHEAKSAECVTWTGHHAGLSMAAYGDSITASDSNPHLGLQSRGSWYSDLICPGTFANGGNRGVAGQTSAQILARLQSDHPHVDVLVIEAGTNDLRLKVPTATTLQNLDDLISLGKRDADTVVVTTVQPWTGTDATALNDGVRRLAEKDGVPVADFASILAAPSRTQDGVHPTESAASLLGEAVTSAVGS